MLKTFAEKRYYENIARRLVINAEIPTSTDYPQSLWKIAKKFSFLRTTENSNFSTGILKMVVIRNVAKKALNKKI